MRQSKTIIYCLLLGLRRMKRKKANFEKGKNSMDFHYFLWHLVTHKSTLEIDYSFWTWRSKSLLTTTVDEIDIFVQTIGLKVGNQFWVCEFIYVSLCVLFPQNVLPFYWRWVMKKKMGKRWEYISQWATKCWYQSSFRCLCK